MSLITLGASIVVELELRASSHVVHQTPTQRVAKSGNVTLKGSSLAIRPTHHPIQYELYSLRVP